MRELVAARRQLPHLDASVAAEIIEIAHPAVLPVLRRHPLGPMLGLYNVTDSWAPWPAARLTELGLARARDAIAGRPVEIAADGNVWLPPYAARWIV